MGMLATYYNILARPGYAMRRASEERPMALALITLLIIAFTQVVSKSIGASYPFKANAGLFIVGYLSQLLGYLITIFLMAVFFHYFATAFGGGGSGGTLFGVLCLSMLPMIFFPPLALGLQALGAIGKGLMMLIKLLVTFWVLGLMIVGIREVYRLNTGKAISVFLMPIGIMVLGAILVSVFAIIALVIAIASL